jgi:hypothetical protein
LSAREREVLRCWGGDTGTVSLPSVLVVSLTTVCGQVRSILAGLKDRGSF